MKRLLVVALLVAWPSASATQQDLGVAGQGRRRGLHFRARL